MEIYKPSRTREESLCPCKSLKSYGTCCFNYHLGKSFPQTAEQLMRSRYSAYFFRLVDYLVATTHPDQKTPMLLEEIQEIANATTWKFLEILSTSKGGKEDKSGKVEFLATYFVDNEEHQHHENSRFRRYKGQWKYVDNKG